MRGCNLFAYCSYSIEGISGKCFPTPWCSPTPVSPYPTAKWFKGANCAVALLFLLNKISGEYPCETNYDDSACPFISACHFFEAPRF